MNNIIFLDIDGVLNHELFYEERDNSYEKYKTLPYHMQNIDKDKVELLNQLCKSTNSKVVISSTWRVGRTVEELQNIFKDLDAEFEVIDKTPECSINGYPIASGRGSEINYWLGANVDKCQNYVIFDDDNFDILLSQQNKFIHIDRWVGLTPTNIFKAECLLLYKEYNG